MDEHFFYNNPILEFKLADGTTGKQHYYRKECSDRHNSTDCSAENLKWPCNTSKQQFKVVIITGSVVETPRK